MLELENLFIYELHVSKWGAKKNSHYIMLGYVMPYNAI